MWNGGGVDLHSLSYRSSCTCNFLFKYNIRNMGFKGIVCVYSVIDLSSPFLHLPSLLLCILVCFLPQCWTVMACVLSYPSMCPVKLYICSTTVCSFMFSFWCFLVFLPLSESLSYKIIICTPVPQPVCLVCILWFYSHSVSWLVNLPGAQTEVSCPHQANVVPKPRRCNWQWW